MSTPSPLLPSGVLEGASAPKSRVRITVLTILALHVVFIGGLLLQGCQKNARDASGAPGASNVLSTLPPLTENTNYFSSFPGDTTASTPAPSTTSAPPVEPPASSQSNPARPGSSIPSFAETASQSTQSGYGTTPQGSSEPANPGVSPLASSPAMTEYTIKKNDTIGELAKRYGVSIQAILGANPDVRPRSLRVNSKLMIPAPGPATAESSEGAATATEPTPPPGGDLYTVQRGDNLTKIAKKYGITVSQLREANNLRGNLIKPKQRLKIPAKTGATDRGTSPSAHTY